jgi:hypothetical protein
MGLSRGLWREVGSLVMPKAARGITYWESLAIMSPFSAALVSNPWFHWVHRDSGFVL